MHEALDGLGRGSGARRPPAQDLEQVGRGQGLPGAVGEGREEVEPQARDPRAAQVGFEGRAERAALVAAADGPRGASRRGPGSGERGPAARERQLEPVLARERHRERGRVLAVVDDEAGRERELGNERGGRLVDLEGRREATQVAHAQPARAQDVRGRGLPQGQEVRDEPDHVLGCAGGLGRDGVLGEVRGVGLGWVRGRARVRAAAAQRERDLARQDDVTLVRGEEQAVAQEPGRGLAAHGVGAGRDPHGRPPGQGVEDAPRPWGSVGEESAEGYGRLVGRRARRRVGERGGRVRGAEPRRVGAEDLGQARGDGQVARGRRVRRVGGTPVPQQGPLEQVRDRRADERGVGGLGRQGGQEPVDRDGRVGSGWGGGLVPEDQDGVEHLQLEGVEAGDGPVQAGTAGGAGCERTQGRRRRSGQVRALHQQRDEVLVAAGAKSLGEGPARSRRR
ncbi:hypothetical protein OJAG_00830 [Oerskovia enterophila]|uniref:Uncharacterized protein n=1 Tax=Oerskovia enterophila TaxID=43678 RepID=A0A163T7N5_9CELL|nr:hypothetical protein OJAG_00830 [Oerskovia enterophila]